MELCSPSPRLDEYIQGRESQEYIQGGKKLVQCLKLYILYMYLGYYLYVYNVLCIHSLKHIYVCSHVYLGAFRWSTPNVFSFNET